MVKCDYCDSTNVRATGSGYECEDCYHWPEGGHAEPCWDDHPRPAQLTVSCADILKLQFDECERQQEEQDNDQ